MKFERYRQQPNEARDVADGSRPALLFALGLGIVTGSVVAAVFLIASFIVAAAGGFGPGAGGLLASVGVWFALWIAVSIGVAAGLGVAMRAWLALYPSYVRRNHSSEEHDAVTFAEALLRDARESKR